MTASFLTQIKETDYFITTSQLNWLYITQWHREKAPNTCLPGYFPFTCKFDIYKVGILLLWATWIAILWSFIHLWSITMEIRFINKTFGAILTRYFSDLEVPPFCATHYDMCPCLWTYYSSCICLVIAFVLSTFIYTYISFVLLSDKNK